MPDNTLQGAAEFPPPPYAESANSAEFAARWNERTPEDRETFFQAIRKSDEEYARWWRGVSSEADIIAWFGRHSSESVRRVIDAGEAIITERVNDGVTA